MSDRDWAEIVRRDHRHEVYMAARIVLALLVVAAVVVAHVLWLS